MCTIHVAGDRNKGPGISDQSFTSRWVGEAICNFYDVGVVHTFFNGVIGDHTCSFGGKKMGGKCTKCGTLEYRQKLRLLVVPVAVNQTIYVYYKKNSLS